MNKNRNDNLILFICFSVSALMLTFIQAPFCAGVLAWVCLVSFIFACTTEAKGWTIVWVSYLVSVCYWLGNLYWIAYVTAPAYVLLCMYLGLYWPILAMAIRYFYKKCPSMVFLVTACLFTGAEVLQGVLFTGFSWRFLGHSQYANLSFIQIADIFGVSGISFIIVMVNGVLAAGLIGIYNRRFSFTSNVVRVCVVCLVVALAIVYGRGRIAETAEYTEDGPLVGAVQPNCPSNVKELAENAEMILAGLLREGEETFAAGAELVAWPETMVLTAMNKSYLMLCDPASEPRVFDEMIAEHCKGKGYTLIGAHGAEFVLLASAYSLKDKYNSAFLYRPEGKQDNKRYDKIHLIPFGEYIPFKQSWPFFYHTIMKLSPYDYEYDLTKGSEYTVFEMDSGEKTYRFSVLICYEDTDSRLTRKMVVSPDGSKRVDWLVNVSNDGWYVRYKDDRVLPSPELAQRTIISAFRAIENRVSILRSVNTGISCMIDSVGRIKDGFIAGTLPERAMDRQGVEGWFADTIQIDTRVTFFSKHRNWLDIFCGSSFIIAVLVLMVAKIRSNKCKETSE